MAKSFILYLVGRGLFKQYLYYILKINLSLEKKYNSMSITKHGRAVQWGSLSQSEKWLGFQFNSYLLKYQSDFSTRRMRSFFTERDHCLKIHMTRKHKPDLRRGFRNVN